MFAECLLVSSGPGPATGLPQGPEGRKAQVTRVARGYRRSYRSRSITLAQAATKSFTNFSLASSLA